MLRIFGLTYEINEKLLKRVAREAFLHLGGDFEVNLRFVSEKKIRELNRIYRNRDLATDVLSFNMDDTKNGGDIVICYVEVQRHAKKWRMPISNAASLLFVHGILHLAGFLHTKTKDRAKMEKAEEEILSKAKVKIER